MPLKLAVVARTTAALLLATTIVAGCGSAPPTSPISGIDQLTIPTPDPVPNDFVATVDNPWFPLPAGATWSYADDLGHRQVWRVATAPTQIAGITTWPVTVTTTSGQRQVAQSTDYYAQDASGHVWWFGADGPSYDGARSWRAGSGGAEAGVIVTAVPRVGDGYRTAQGTGADRITTVLSLRSAVTTPFGAWDDAVELGSRRADVAGSMSTGIDERWFLVSGVGLVQSVVEIEGVRAELSRAS